MRRGTYSIVARDPATGELGAAVHSHWFAVGAIVPWVRAGVGAVCTQSVAEPAYGPRILDLLARGSGARAALDQLLAEDESARFRQVGVVDAHGGVGVHTGEGCIAFAGHETGAGLSAQANMMARATVWGAMARAYDAAAGPLARRLQAALHAAEGQGGDVRGRQSAALVVARPGDEPWRHRVDVRVDDHSQPLAELDRLLDLSDAYALATEGDDLVGEGRHEEAGRRYAAAAEIAPGNDELLFWAGLAAAQAGDLPTALDRVRAAIAIHPGWRDLLGRLEPEIAPGAPAVSEALDARGA
jgi:uncharacterized Ntn-hydrolase superfamily protein